MLKIKKRKKNVVFLSNQTTKQIAFLYGTRSKEAYQPHRREVGNEVRNVEVNVGKVTSQSGCKVMPCNLLHASTENIVTGR